MDDRARSFRVPAWLQDLVLAVFVTVLQVQGVRRVAAESEVVARPLDDLAPLAVSLLVVSGAVLVLRRRWPTAVFAVVAACSLAYYGLDYPDGPVWLALFVALYTLTAYGDGRRSLVVAATGIAVLAVGWLVAGADVEPRAAIGWVFFRIGASVMSAALGESVRTRKVIAAEAVARAEQAERTRDETARARADAERLRIAREVHDTVAHAIAVINVQAGVTAHVLDKRPEHARDALTVIEQTSARALGEMRTILGVLRDQDDGRTSYPGIDQLDDLAGQARGAGLDLKLEAAAPPTPVPSAVGAAVYRIVQESVTNVVRHAGPTRVTVAVAYGTEAVEVRVSDDGPGEPRRTAARRDAPGHGLAGMRERCALLGGSLSAGPVAGGGFEVAATLPLVPAGRETP